MKNGDYEKRFQKLLPKILYLSSDYLVSVQHNSMMKIYTLYNIYTIYKIYTLYNIHTIYKIYTLAIH